MMTENQMKYTKTHQWIKKEDAKTCVVGITSYAQDQLGMIVYVSLPEIGRFFKEEQEVAVVESAKVASEVYTPVAGKIVGVNTQLRQTPALVNISPEEQGWFFKIEPSDLTQIDGLMDKTSYEEFIKAENI